MESLQSVSDPLRLTDDERRTIQLARQFEGLKMNPAWQALYDALKQWRDESMQLVRQAKYASPIVRSNLLLRFDERDNLIGFIDNYLKEITEARKLIIRNLAELNGHHGEAAEDLVAALEGR